MSRIIDKKSVEQALKQAALKSTSWQYWPKQNRDGRLKKVSPNDQKPTASDYEVSRFKFKMSHLRELPRDQRALFLVATKIANEMLLLQRQAIVYENGFAEAEMRADKAELNAQIIMHFMSLIALAGKLWESFEAIRKFSRLWKQDSTLRLSDEGKTSLDEINKAFSHGSTLAEVRKRVAFHLDADLLTDHLDFRLPNTEPDEFEMILSSDYTNTLYLTIEAISAFAVLDIVGPKDNRQAAMINFHDLVLENARHMMTFATAAVLAVMDTVSTVDAGETINMGNRPNLNDQTLHFFVNPPPKSA
jgi:hypothetical protein